jgi:tRNA-dihydrouridine synthase B
MRLGNLIIDPPVVLAPMAGVTDRPFRQLCRRFGAGMVYSEFLSSDGLIRGVMPQSEKILFEETERPIGFQLFGARSVAVAEAAAILCRAKPDIIDLNFGCPVKKVIRKNGGAAILKNLDLLADIVRRTAEVVDRPLTVKMRAGFEEKNPVFIEAAQRAVEAGAQAVTLHARSGQSGYKKPANWNLISELKNAIDVPVIGNGDIRSPTDAAAILQQTGCDAVMVGRAALGRPWIFRQIAEYLQTGQIVPQPTLDEIFDIIEWHLAESQKLHGRRRGLLRMRRQMGWYVRGLPEKAALRRELFTADDHAAVSRTLRRYRLEHPEVDSESPSAETEEPEPLSDTRGSW